MSLASSVDIQQKDGSDITILEMRPNQHLLAPVSSRKDSSPPFVASNKVEFGCGRFRVLDQIKDKQLGSKFANKVERIGLNT
jgi:hypothetical protein